MKDFNRRSLFKAAGLSTSAFCLPVYIPDALGKAASKMMAQGLFMPNAFVAIDPENKVAVYLKHLEMGQGVYTGLTTILAEELDFPMDQIQLKAAPADVQLYKNFAFGVQGTGGSTAMANSYQQLREAGAMAREMLKAAAAKRWQTSAASLTSKDGKIYNPQTKASLTYGELTKEAKRLTPPKSLPLKSKTQFEKIGKHNTRLDGLAKTNGTATFAIDVRRPRRATALVARPEEFGSRPVKFDDKAARKISGFLGAFKIPSGIAVVAEDFWTAQRARQALKIEWDKSQAWRKSSDDIDDQYQKLVKQEGLKFAQKGDDVQKVFEKSSQVLEATYTVPYLAHAPLEPLNCTIEYTGDGGAQVWAGSQMQTLEQGAVSKILGLPPEKVKIHTTLAGGSFGRRATPNSDYVSEAAHILKAAKSLKRPIHLMWTREDDIKGGFYRPTFLHHVKVGLSESGDIQAWKHRIVGQSIVAGTPFAAMAKDGIDATSVEGVQNLVYDVPHFYADLHSPTQGVPVLWWRSVGHTHTAFAVETMMDELARATKQDPVAYRLKYLKNHPRHAAVLKEAAKQAGWKPGRGGGGKGYGVAVHESFNSYVAQVLEVSVVKNQIKVDRITCAVDCGLAINPEIIKTQIEGGIGFALSAALHQKLTLEEGRVKQSNFHDFPLLRFNEMPEIAVHIVEGADTPTGVGEPGVPPVFPAISNAIADATGKRIRSFPLVEQGSFA